MLAALFNLVLLLRQQGGNVRMLVSLEDRQILEVQLVGSHVVVILVLLGLG